MVNCNTLFHGLILALFCAVTFSVPTAFGDEKTTSWRQLSAAEREILAPLSDSWDKLPPYRQQQLLRQARQTPPEKREALHRELEYWRNLSAEQQRQRQQQRERFESLSPEQREKVLRARERFKNRPPEEQEKLREKWKREKWRKEQRNKKKQRKGKENKKRQR